MDSAEINTPPNGGKVPATPTRQMSAEEFITSAPLYVTIAVDNFVPPSQIRAACSVCKSSETDWSQAFGSTPVGSGADHGKPADWDLMSVGYVCFRCKKATLTVIYKAVETEMRTHKPVIRAAAIRIPPTPPSQYSAITKVMKYGQAPAQEAHVPPSLKETLGKDGAELYRKALLSRGAGFGLAAVAYMRRVVEEKTNELIEVVADFAESFDVDAEIVKEIRSSINPEKYTPFERKLEIAAAVFPSGLKIGNTNPLQVLFGEVSKALHGLSEEECLRSADEIRLIFEYVFGNLRAQSQSRRKFEEDLKRIMKR